MTQIIKLADIDHLRAELFANDLLDPDSGHDVIAAAGQAVDDIRSRHGDDHAAAWALALISKLRARLLPNGSLREAE